MPRNYRWLPTRVAVDVFAWEKSISLLRQWITGMLSVMRIGSLQPWRSYL